MTSLFDIKNGKDLGNVKEPTEKRLLVDELIPHVENREYQQERMEALVYNISEQGLLQPIIVNIKSDTGEKEILAGHHRVKAYQHLHYKTGSDDYLMIRSWVFNDLSEEEKLIVLLSTNPDYESGDDDKLKILNQAKTLYEKLVEQGKKPIGRQRDWLVNVTGLSQYYIRKFEGDVEEKKGVEKKKKDKPTLDEQAKKIIKQFEKQYDFLIDNYQELDPELQKKISSWIVDLDNSIR